MNNYTAEQMERIRTLAFIQMKEGLYFINVPDVTGDIDIQTPWMDESGRFDLTDEEAVKYWGSDIFNDFCEKALAYLADDTVNNRVQ